LRAGREARIVARSGAAPKANVRPIIPTPERRTAGASDARGWSNVLADIPLFAGLGRRHLNKVAALGRIRRFHEGATIVAVGEPGDTLYVLLDGEVSVRRRRLPSISRGMGSFFGEMALLDGGPRSATVVANGPVVCLTISRSGFQKLLRKEPAISCALLTELATRLRAAESVADE
jgi:CRP-like cAMP-binding protein